MWRPPNRPSVVNEYLAAELDVSRLMRLNRIRKGLATAMSKSKSETRPESVEEMKRQVYRVFNRLSKRPDPLPSFFRNTGIGAKRLTWMSIIFHCASLAFCVRLRQAPLASPGE
jgi:hypothetical protein